MCSRDPFVLHEPPSTLPFCSGVLYQLGRLAEEHRDDQQGALRLFEKASLSDPTLSDAVCRYARMMWRVEGDVEGAGVLLRAAIEGNASQALVSVGAGGRGGFESMAGRALAKADASEGSAGRVVKHPKEPSVLHSQVKPVKTKRHTSHTTRLEFASIQPIC